MIIDAYAEKMVKRKQGIADLLFKITLPILAFFLVLFVLIYIRIPLINMVFIVLILYGAFFLLTKMNVEYEYIYTNGNLDLDVIYAHKNRKRLFTVKESEFELIAPLSEEYASEIGSPDIAKKVYAISSRDAENIYFAIFNLPVKGKTILFFEPGEEMLELFSKAMPRKVKHNNI